MPADELIDFINREIEKGKSRSNIKSTLLNIGWKRSDILNALAKVSSLEESSSKNLQYNDVNPLAENKKTASSRRNFKFLILLLPIVILAAFGIYYFFDLQPNGISVPLIETPAGQVSLSLTELKQLLGNLDKTTSLEITDETGSSIEGCNLTGHYTGYISGQNQYGLIDSSTGDEKSASECSQKNISPVFAETYWMGEDIYSRQDKNKNFEKLASDSKILISPKPGNYLTQYLSGESSINVASVLLSGDKLKAKVKVKAKEFSGEFVFTMDTRKDRKIESVSYQLDKKNYGSIMGEIKLNYSSKPLTVPLPTLSSYFTLAYYFDDINSYANVYYRINAEKYLLYNNKNYPNIRALAGEGAGAKSKDCNLSQKKCQTKLTELKNYFGQVKNLIKDARSAFCREEHPQVGPDSEIYKNHLVFKLSNDNRNPKETSDFSITADFAIGGEKEGSYIVKMKYGKEFCFEGKADKKELGDLSQEMENFVNAL